MDLAGEPLALLVHAAVAFDAASSACAARSSSMVCARVSASVTMRVMNNPNDSDRTAEITAEMMIMSRSPVVKSDCAHRTNPNAVTTTNVVIRPACRQHRPEL